MICHQRRIRDEKAEADPRPIMASLRGCEVDAVLPRQAKRIILEYEWLGATRPEKAMGRALACYGLRTPDGQLAGVVVFGQKPHGTEFLDGDYKDLIICLERGACVHWAHPHAASFLINRAVTKARIDHGWELFHAYSDPSAGEIGTVYQAANWLYLGRGRRTKKGKEEHFRYALRPPDVDRGDIAGYQATRRLRTGGFREIWERSFDEGSIDWTEFDDPAKNKKRIPRPPRDYPGNATFMMARALGYSIERVPARHLYATISASRKRRKFWLEELAKHGWAPKPYPKRAPEIRQEA